MNTLPIQNLNISIAALANANELTRAVAMEVVGNDIADTINGSALSKQTIYSLAQATFMSHLSTYRKN